MKKLILFAWMALMASCTSMDPVTRYNNEHKDRSFEYAMKNNQAFTLKSAKEGFADVKKKTKEQEKKEKELAKIQEINRKIEELKKNN